MTLLQEMLRDGAERGASDILISAGSPVSFHINGSLVPWRDERLSAEESRELSYALLKEEGIRDFERNHELDSSYELEGVANFRVSMMMQKGTVGCVLRVVPLREPHYSDLGLSRDFIEGLARIPNGLLLVTGGTGAGKSSTVASFLNYLNSEHPSAKHIITLEDPIEYRMRPHNCVIDQREVGSDTFDYPSGLKSALRQMPHVIFVGEMRDRKTIEISLTAAETGNLVISTLATQSAAKTVNRIIDVFPPEDQAEIRTRLAMTLRCVLSQVLLPRSDGEGRVAAREILFVNKSIENLIRENKVQQIDNVIASSSAEGMCLLDDSLMHLLSSGVVAAESVLPRLQNPRRVESLLKV